MRKSSYILETCLWSAIVLAAAAFAQNPNEKYLTAADVEKVTGLKGVREIPRGSAAGAGGDLNFVDASGELILMVQISDAKSFAGFKGKYAKGALSGVGDEAVQGSLMPGIPDNLLAFRKGTRCIVLTAFADFIKKKVYLTADQLSALGKVMAPRL